MILSPDPDYGLQINYLFDSVITTLGVGQVSEILPAQVTPPSVRYRTHYAATGSCGMGWIECLNFNCLPPRDGLRNRLNRRPCRIGSTSCSRST